MTFWLDAQLDPELAPWLGAHFRVVAKSLDEIGSRHAKDQTIVDAARRFGPVVIVTKDYDFVELIQRLGSPPQVLWLSFGNMATIRIQLKLQGSFPAALKLLEGGEPIVEIA